MRDVCGVEQGAPGQCHRRLGLSAGFTTKNPGVARILLQQSALDNAARPGLPAIQPSSKESCGFLGPRTTWTGMFDQVGTPLTVRGGWAGETHRG